MSLYTYEKMYKVEKDCQGKLAIKECKNSKKTWDEAFTLFQTLNPYPKTLIRVSNERY